MRPPLGVLARNQIRNHIVLTIDALPEIATQFRPRAQLHYRFCERFALKWRFPAYEYKRDHQQIISTGCPTVSASLQIFEEDCRRDLWPIAMDSTGLAFAKRSRLLQVRSRTSPQHCFGIILTLLLACGGGWTWHWYQHRPKPRYVKVMIEAIPVTKLEKELKFPTLDIRFSDSAARLEGLEVHRELLDKDNQPIKRTKLGEPIHVRLQARTVRDESVTNVAIIDLLPGGFEVVGASLQPGVSTISGVDYVDVREDRAVFYGTLSGNVLEINYQIKSSNRGEFTVPPVFAESMYERAIKGCGVGGRISVTE